jgi:hypothetical protein
MRPTRWRPKALKRRDLFRYGLRRTLRAKPFALAAGLTVSGFVLFPPVKATGNEVEAATYQHAAAAIGLSNQAAQLNNTQGQGEFTDEQMAPIFPLNVKALAETEQADITTLNKYFEGFGDHFRDEFIEGLRASRLFSTIRPFSHDQPIA